jgi:hypothetical protein
MTYKNIKFFHITILTLFCFSLCAADIFAEPQTSSREPNQPRYLKPISPDKLKEDLDFLFKTIEEVHPNMYAYTTKEEFTQLRERLYQSVNRPMNRLEFYKITAPVVAKLKNGHMNLDWPDEFKAYVNNGGKVFPLKLYWDGQNAILSENRGRDALPMGGVVVSINEENVCQLLAKMAKYRADELKNSDIFFAGMSLHRYLWLEYGRIKSWNLQIKGVDGEIKDYIVKPISWEQYLANKPNKKDYSYRYISEYNTGLIEFKSCFNLRKFKEFLKQTFKKIHDQKVSNLIIDVRHNVGGESTLGNALLDYITDEPFREAERVDIKISKQIHGDNLEEIRKKFPSKNIEIGSVITDEEISFIKPSDNLLRFRGSCFLLIDRLVFSSASQFASMIKCFNIATIIGEETWGTTAAYGAIQGFNLPNLGLGFSVPHKYIVQACGKPDGRGVLPDYEVKQKPEDTAKGIDTVLQFTLNLIKNSDAEKWKNCR